MNSTLIESNFSILKREKDSYRDNSLDVSLLEGVFQTKRFDTLAIM
jgi:hypothetical protein